MIKMNLIMLLNIFKVSFIIIYLHILNTKWEHHLGKLLKEKVKIIIQGTNVYINILKIF